MKAWIGTKELEVGGKYLGVDLRDSNDIVDDVDALHLRLRDEGYLLIRGLHDRDAILDARRAILEQVAAKGALDPSAPLMDAVMNPAGQGLGGVQRELAKTPRLREVLESPRAFAFFDRFFGEPSRTFDYKWLRLVGKGGTSGAHYDIVYMGRGSQRLVTCWTPLGDIALEQGPLAICLGSDRFEKVKQTYGQMDVDRDLVDGWFSTDPVEIVDKFGGRWATTEFRAGDALIFGMHLMHGSVRNETNRYRMSCDTRFQPRADPVDERWIGEKPKAHYALSDSANQEKLVPMDRARKEWGIA